MPKMTHWNSPDTIDVSSDKVAVYVAQGWVSAGKGAAAPSVTAMTTSATNEAAEPKKAPAKKAAKSTAKKAAKKS